ncbi:hypothetical protein TSOC_015361, partial [Tetrabaena socialis]
MSFRVLRALQPQPRPLLKGEVRGYCSGQGGAWRETNALTQEALGRLGGARQLVRSLGLSATEGGAHGGMGE